SSGGRPRLDGPLGPSSGDVDRRLWTGPSDPPAETGGWTGPSDPPAETRRCWTGPSDPPAETGGWTGPSDPPAETRRCWPGWRGSPEPPAETDAEPAGAGTSGSADANCSGTGHAVGLGCNGWGCAGQTVCPKCVSTTQSPAGGESSPKNGCWAWPNTSHPHPRNRYGCRDKLGSGCLYPGGRCRCRS
uniref:Uncharacterized protein n=1 Tax=Astatotilapia calliptera TaxID=8154 RepID=A0AAX7SHM6_ASTCA